MKNDNRVLFVQNHPGVWNVWVDDRIVATFPTRSQAAKCAAQWERYTEAR